MEVTNYLLSGMILQVGGGDSLTWALHTADIGEDSSIWMVPEQPEHVGE